MTNQDIVAFMICVAMKVDGGSYYSFSELKSFDVLYPFEYNISKEEFMSNNNVIATNLGGELSIALKSGK